MTKTPASETRPSGRTHRARSIAVLVMLGPPVIMLSAGFIGSAFAYAIFGGIRAYRLGEPERSDFIE